MSEPFEPRAVELLRRERASGVAPKAARDRLSTRLAAAVPAFVSGPSAKHPLDTPGAGGGGGALARAGFSTMRAVVISFVVGGAAGAGAFATLAPPKAAQVVYVDRPVPMPMAPKEAPAPSVAPPATEGPSPPAPPPAASASPSASAAVARPALAQLDAERALLDGARSALSRGDAARALEELGRHERLYPQPILREEREALTVEALVRAGRYEDARAHADTFRRASPSSIFLSVVEASIRSIP